MNMTKMESLNKKFTSIRILTKEQHDELVKHVNAVRKREENGIILEKQKMFKEETNGRR